MFMYAREDCEQEAGGRLQSMNPGNPTSPQERKLEKKNIQKIKRICQDKKNK